MNSTAQARAEKGIDVKTHDSYVDKDGRRRALESAEQLAEHAGRAQSAGNWHEAAGWWFAAASVAETPTARDRYTRAFERAKAASLRGAA